MKAYVIAKLLWDPELDPDALIDEFLRLYYGPAAAPIEAYIRLLERQVDRLDDCHMGCFAPVDGKFFTEELLDEADALLETALRLADNEVLQERVRIVRMQITYVRMMLMNDRFVTMRNAFFDEAAQLGITRITEWKPLAESRNRMEAGLTAN